MATVSGATVNIPAGSFQTQTLTYTASSTPPSGDLTITLTTGYQGDFKNVLLSVIGGSTVRYYVADSLGTARVVTDANGAVRDDSDFYPFGGERPIQSTSGNNYSFTGKERDSESGLDDFGARYFGSTIGRFTSPDPLLSSGRPTEPQTWNRYAYALNNPVKFVDPNGLWDWDETTGRGMTDQDLQALSGDKDDKRYKWAKKALKYRQQFRAALESARAAASSSTPAVQAAVNAYGTENDGNGVFVGFYNGGYGATTELVNDDTISVMFGSSSKGDFLAATVAHEGAHVDQAQTWLKGGESSFVT